MQASLLLLLSSGLVVSGATSAAEPGVASVTQQHLFRIERSKNGNVVQYDIRLDPDGLPVATHPIVAYWLREDGSTDNLTALQKSAYGFKAKCSEDCSVVTIRMQAKIGRKIRVYRVDSLYRAEIPIAGKAALVERIYIKSTRRRFLWPRVDYIDFRGTDIETEELRSERFAP